MLKVQAVGVAPRVSSPPLPEGAGAAAAQMGTRRCGLQGGALDTAIYDGSRLGAGDAVEGPAIIEDRFSTVVLHPGMRAVLDEADHYAITVGPAVPVRRQGGAAVATAER